MHYVEAKSLLTKWNGMNIYRGCTHGCIYCDSRSSCYNFEHKFEDIEVKKNAPELLENILKSKRKKCMISTGSMSDPYMPIESNLGLTRKCLEVIDKYGFEATVITKSDLILRDLDLLKSINKKAKCVVQMTLTTYDEELCKKLEPNVCSTNDEELCKKLEPNVCSTKRRFEVLKTLNENNIPTIVWFTPILPFINDTKENIQGILDYCVKANVKGIICWNVGMTLRDGDREYYIIISNKLGVFMSLFGGNKESYKDKKSLIIYFSRADENYSVGYIDKGNTEYIAEYVAEITNADLFKVEPAVPYSKDYRTCIEEAKYRVGNAPIKENVGDISEYEVIYIMSPIYWGTYAPEMETALKDLDFTGKTIRIVTTHEGSGLASVPSDVKRICKGANVLDDSIAIRGAECKNAKIKIENWV